MDLSLFHGAGSGTCALFIYLRRFRECVLALPYKLPLVWQLIDLACWLDGQQRLADRTVTGSSDSRCSPKRSRAGGAERHGDRVVGRGRCSGGKRAKEAVIRGPESTSEQARLLQSVTALIERQVRSGMLRQGIEALPLLPEGRMTSAPTAARILEAFTDISWFEFERGEDLVAFPIKLTPLQLQLLDLLEVPRSIYT